MKKRNLSTVILIVVFLLGIGILLYPSVSDWWNRRVQTKTIQEYESVIQGMEKKDYTQEMAQAQAYNEALAGLDVPLSDYDEVEGYERLLDVTGSGIMGYLTVPRIDLKVPIYHGTSDSVLTIASGHMQGTSLPVGGEGTHAVLSAHRGLPSAKLFSRLDEMKKGDTFSIRVLDQVLTYEVDQIRVVKPDETEEISIREGEDHVTLLTCTPYGINTHRLLVRGTRIENPDDAKEVVLQEKRGLDPLRIAMVIAASVLLILLLILLIRYRKRR